VSSGIRVIFLDFDGVLNSKEHFATLDKTSPPTAQEMFYIDKIRRIQGDNFSRKVAVLDIRSVSRTLVGRVQWLVDETDASVVISSAWRHAYLIPSFQVLLEFHGFKGRILDVTPSLKSLRGHEIQAWLDLHPEVEAFCILDDDDDMAHLGTFHVRTDFSVGLTEQDKLKALEILTSPKV